MEELKFLKLTEESYQRHEKGEFQKMNFDEFIEEIKRW
jgi:hypothetical protein